MVDLFCEKHWNSTIKFEEKNIQITHTVDLFSEKYLYTTTTTIERITRYNIAHPAASFNSWEPGPRQTFQRTVRYIQLMKYYVCLSEQSNNWNALFSLYSLIPDYRVDVGCRNSNNVYIYIYTRHSREIRMKILSFSFHPIILIPFSFLTKSHKTSHTSPPPPSLVVLLSWAEENLSW